MLGCYRLKFALGIKNINILLIVCCLTHIHRCVLALYTKYFPELCGHQGNDQGAWRQSPSLPPWSIRSDKWYKGATRYIQFKCQVYWFWYQSVFLPRLVKHNLSFHTKFALQYCLWISELSWERNEGQFPPGSHPPPKSEPEKTQIKNMR